MFLLCGLAAFIPTTAVIVAERRPPVLNLEAGRAPVQCVILLGPIQRIVVREQISGLTRFQAELGSRFVSGNRIKIDRHGASFLQMHGFTTVGKLLQEVRVVE